MNIILNRRWWSVKRSEYYHKARKIYEEQVEQEIERIANKLKEDDLAKERKEIQDKCLHANTRSYNHGYHTSCLDCGKSL